MKARQKRIIAVILGIITLALAAYLVINALGSNLSYFYSPSDVVDGKAPDNHLIRLGGLVMTGSLERGKELTVTFKVTDNVKTVTVKYAGILPDLFAEGQGVIAQGRLGADGIFIADEVLAKHDENYMPPEVADALKQAQPEGAKQ